MSIRLIDPNSGSDEVFNNVSFVENSYFSLRSVVGNEIRVAYHPKVDSSWDIDSCDLFLLDNPYLNAENDVFEIYDNTLQERIGWVFPITILISNENDFSEYKNLNKYKFVAQYKLLNDYAKAISWTGPDKNWIITDFFNEASIICIINNRTTATINNFNINNYLLSFYKYGYSFLQDSAIRNKILSKEKFVYEMRQPNRRRLNIKKTGFDISSNGYIKSLFDNYLLKTDDFLVRFIFLYQVIEQLMEEEFGVLFQQYLLEYTEKRISKNDFKEYLNMSSKERDLIRSIFVNTEIDSGLKVDFETAFDYLYAELDQKVKESLSDRIYDFRNLVTHSYRNVIDKNEIINNIIQMFEEIIICLLTNYTRNKLTTLGVEALAS